MTHNIEKYYPGAVEEHEFMAKSAAKLAQHGFNTDNTLPIVSICRDEICHTFVLAVEKHWGNSFVLGGFGGFPMAGETGMRVAASHCPNVYDRERIVIYALTHIGFGPADEVGGCIRPGMDFMSNICGSLVAYTEQLRSGELDKRVFTNDPEFGFVKQRLSKVLPEGVSDLYSVTQYTLRSIIWDIDNLTGTVLDTGKCDYAVFTGTQIHLQGENLVHMSDSWLVVNGRRQIIHRLD